MYLDEVVGEVSQGNGRDMILDLFRKGVSQSGKPACSHPHAEVMTFDIAGVDVLRVGRPGNRVALTTKAHGGAVALLSIVRDAVDLHQHRVVDIARKRLIDRLDVKLQSIAGKLDATRKTAGEVFDKVSGTLRIALANQPARYQLRIGVNRGPKPRIARAGVLRCDIWRNILLLGVAKRPALVNLHPLAFEVLKHAVLVVGTKGTYLEDQPHDGLFGHAGYADSGADGIAFDQATDDFGALFGSEPVHTSSMPDGSRIVKTFEKITSKYGGVQRCLKLWLSPNVL